jgi:protein involved in polysaccharide export with SLBB domain
MRFLLIIALALMPSLAPAQNFFGRKKAQEPTNAPLPSSAASPIPSRVLQNGDVVDMRLSGPPDEYTKEFAIPQMAVEDGTVTIPMVGRVRAAGLSPSQLGAAIEKRLIEEKIFSVANVNINMLQIPRYVIVGGAVRGPGRQLWTQNLTLTAAISAAGGPAEYIEDTVRLIRGGQVARYSRKAIKANPTLDPKLFPDDVVEAEGEF